MRLVACYLNCAITLAVAFAAGVAWGIGSPANTLTISPPQFDCLPKFAEYFSHKDALDLISFSKEVYLSPVGKELVTALEDCDGETLGRLFQCGICQGDLSTETVGTFVTCGHTMHIACFKEHQEKTGSTACPFCGSPDALICNHVELPTFTTKALEVFEQNKEQSRRRIEQDTADRRRRIEQDKAKRKRRIEQVKAERKRRITEALRVIKARVTGIFKFAIEDVKNTVGWGGFHRLIYGRPDGGLVGAKRHEKGNIMRKLEVELSYLPSLDESISSFPKLSSKTIKRDEALQYLRISSELVTKTLSFERLPSIASTTPFYFRQLTLRLTKIVKLLMNSVAKPSFTSRETIRLFCELCEKLYSWTASTEVKPDEYLEINKELRYLLKKLTASSSVD